MLIKLSQNSPDVILLTGDYYVDHPSFGIAIIARLLESLSLSVWIVSQPDPESNFSELKKLPQPKLFFGITSGSLDSTLNLYTVNKVRRINDVYSPGGKGKNRVKNAVITYANALRNFFPDSVIIAGGVEATLRKFAHYDFFDKKIKPSILENCGINYIFYGMAEKSLSSFVLLLKKKKFEKIKKLPGICYRVENPSSENENYLFLPDFETLSNKQASLEKTSKLILSHTHFLEKKCLIQKQLKHTVISNPPSAPLNSEEIDRIYSLPFAYKPFPELPNSTLPSYEAVKNTVISHRGCGGGCSFCSIGLLQGKNISSRSVNNILKEVKKRKLKSISDLQAPSANMYGFKCKQHGKICRKISCLFPSICPELDFDESHYIKLLQSLKEKNININIASGLRHDILSIKLLDYLLKNSLISGRIKVAPEHSESVILKKMHKPGFPTFEKFVKNFKMLSKRYNKNILIVPYLISAFPGATVENTKNLRNKLLNLIGFIPFQIQDFTPTPGSVATGMYYDSNSEFSKKEIETFRAMLTNKCQRKEKQRKHKHNTVKSKKRY